MFTCLRYTQHMNKTEQRLLLLWFLINIAIGLFIVHDFGISYDEPDYYLYGRNTVDAYKSFFAIVYIPEFGPNDLPNYGPAFIIFPELGVRILKLIFPNILTADVWHFSYFFAFQLGGLCLYSLARRWFSDWSAWGILLLYTSQPLLWGHAFMNPKDIPFLAFFLFTLWSGFRLADSLGGVAIRISMPTIIGSVRTAITSTKRPIPENVPAIHKHKLEPIKLQEIFSWFRYPSLILAGALLGMTMSIRLLGPLPGLIVILYLILTLRQKSRALIIAYLIIAGIIQFLTWPYLWQNPIDHWMDSLVLMAHFPWPAYVLFDGQFYRPNQLPVSYLPVLLNIQLTEPLLILMYAGFGVLIFCLLRKYTRLDLLLVLVIGGLLPLAGLIVARATMYDNFRQILFLLPPLMLLAGLSLDLIFSVLRLAMLRLILLILLAFPGIHAILRLHPYQYVYYNSFIGGIEGAFRRFELDYWNASYREAALWLNKNAPAKAKIRGNEAAYLLQEYLRPDLNPRSNDNPDEQYDYVVLTSRYNQDLTFYPDAQVIHLIKRDRAILTAIKRLSP